MVICLFGMRYRDDADLDTEARLAERLYEELASLPGFISYHHYSADDGELLGVVRFASREALEAWRDSAAHRATWPDAGSFYSEFWIQDCDTYREYEWVGGTRSDVDLRERFAASAVVTGPSIS
jgi:heme-degrading monooxygenase HmoA